MQEISNSQIKQVPDFFSSADNSFIKKILTYLVYQNHGLRIGLELSFCIIVYTILNSLISWEALGVSQRLGTLLAWFGSCFGMILIDQLLLCKTAYIFRQSYLLSLSGAYENALTLLEKISPSSNSLIPLPTDIYHLQKAEILTQAQNFDLAETELQLAALATAEPNRLKISTSRFLNAQGQIEAAIKELEQAQKVLGETSLLLLEQGFLMLDESKNWEAKKFFKKVLALPDMPHFAGETCHSIAQAFLNVTCLSTGEAEDGLDGLNQSIDRINYGILYVDSLRPILARLLLERAYYNARHKEPMSAVIDLKLGRTLCNYSSMTKICEKVQQELLDRHGLKVF
jgi:tetratricopeptide (TPR) repeat protein